jgi:hypothetical protein
MISATAMEGDRIYSVVTSPYDEMTSCAGYGVVSLRAWEEDRPNFVDTPHSLLYLYR